MRKIKPNRAAALLALSALLLTAAPAPVAAAGATGFADVAPGIWYEEALLKIRTYTPGIIDGSVDADGVTRFHPGDPVKRGEFLKMSMTAAEGFTADHSRDGIHWAGIYYTIALENNILIPDPYTGSTPMFSCTYEDLEQPISRYEMAVILSNACTHMQMETPAIAGAASGYIADYAAVGAYAPYNGSSGAGSYVTAVEQAFGKGLLSGYEDGCFHGELTLSRAEATMAIYRQLNWKDSREAPAWAGEAAPSAPVSQQLNPGQSFAKWLQSGHLNGSTPDAEARQLLFGDANRSSFSSASQAEPYMETVTVPIWSIDKTGNKYSTTVGITVNRQVAEEVRSIFQMIYEDSERFPIYAFSVGGARFSDTLRHSWGCAIDINPYYNCECNFRSGYQQVTSGYGWWPAGMEGSETWAGRDASLYRGSMTEPSPYSIRPGGSVVRAFAAYGWGWGGSGTNDPSVSPKGWSSGNSFDFMHFSVLPSGG